MTGPDERLSRTARGWDEAADGYRAYFVPRFAPWVKAAVEAVAEVPDGPILVPCCGTFPELDLLGPRFPGRAIVGIDLSAEMVRLARGDAFIAELRKQYVDQAPPGEWIHHPHARLLAVRKAPSAD